MVKKTENSNNELQKIKFFTSLRNVVETNELLYNPIQYGINPITATEY
jgi:hypothetical protein